MSTAELEKFLSEIDAQLADLPAERRTEIVGEARSHLEAMLAANRADGLDETSAWQKTRRNFGEADAIGAELSREWNRAPRVETVGAPLTKREKWKLFARPIGIAAVFYLLALTLFADEKRTDYSKYGLLALFSFGCMGFGIGRWRRSGGKWTPASIFSYTIFFVLILQSNLHLAFGSQFENTIWETIHRNSSFAMLPLLILSSIWLKRESKSTLPWRYTLKYAQNPIAAEESYRLSPKIGLAMGVTMGCLGNLWMSKFFGLPISGLLCVVEVISALLFSRFVLDKSS